MIGLRADRKGQLRCLEVSRLDSDPSCLCHAMSRDLTHPFQRGTFFSLPSTTTVSFLT